MITQDEAYRIRARITAITDDQQKIETLDAVMAHVDTYVYYNRELLNAAVNLASHLNRVAEHVAADITVNSLGEIQGRGSDVDRLCALRSAAASDVMKFIYLVTRTLKLVTEEEVNELLQGTVFATTVKAKAEA